jgi:DNA-3-methyladenine glycosylase I
MTKKTTKRCDWCLSTELMTTYHDEEWGVPVHNDLKHFEFLVLDAFQAGLSWSTILNKRENFKKAFSGFDPAKIARYGEPQVARLLKDKGIVRNRLKIVSTIGNAKAFVKIQKEHGSFDSLIWELAGGKTVVNRWQTMGEIPAKTKQSDIVSAALKERGFKFVGSTICYAYMQAAGMVNDHLVDCFRHSHLVSGD